MLRKITCTGFKSFDKFSIDFRPGINVIAGPNGSGKTNIIMFMQFLNYLRQSSLIEAVGQSGGAGAIFRRSNDGMIDSIDFAIEGEGTYNARAPRKEKVFARYSFEATIKLDFFSNDIIFTKQHLRVWEKDTTAGYDFFDHPDDARLDITCTVDKHGIVDTLINCIDPGCFRYFRSKDFEEATSELKMVANQYAKTVIIMAFLERLVSSVTYVDQDLWNARAYNILPEKVREPEDVANPPYVKADGTGLAATIYALQRPKEPNLSNYRPYFINFREIENSKEILSQIIEHSKLVNSSVETIYVAPDAYEGKLRITMTVRDGERVTPIPFSLVSDGTAKWFALVTAIMTSRRLFIIEEPENFLHPSMQAAIISMLRNRYDAVDNEEFAIITTHSETIINHSQPHEIILVNMEDGKTLAKRLDNAMDVAQEISRTGFGLGYYYIAGAFE